MSFSVKADANEEFHFAILFTDRLEQEMAQLLTLRKKVSDAERKHRCFQAMPARRTLRRTRLTYESSSTSIEK
jgi:hypothetical protein